MAEQKFNTWNEWKMSLGAFNPMSPDFNPKGKRYFITEFETDDGLKKIGILDCLYVVGISFPEDTENAIGTFNLELFPNGEQEPSDKIMDGLFALAADRYPKQFTTAFAAVEEWKTTGVFPEWLRRMKGKR